MSRRDRMKLRDLEAVLCFGEVPVLRFRIRKFCLEEYELYREDLLPPTLKHYGISWYTINDFVNYLRLKSQASLLNLQ